MSDNGKKEPDFIAAGFHKLEQPLSKRPPKIKWGPIYRAMGMRRKIEYLEKLAATMNHAAYLIQEERNQWAELATKKEKQLLLMKEALDQNNSMIQGEITRMNEEKQKYLKAIKDLKDEIRTHDREAIHGRNR